MTNTNTTTQSDRIVRTRARAWTGQGIGPICAKVDTTDGEVRVWDPVAGHYTTCHALSASAVRRIRSLAGVSL